MEHGGGEDASTGEKEKAVFGTEEVREVGCGEAQIGLAFRSEGMFQPWKRGSGLAWKVPVRRFLWERTLRARLRVEVETGAD